MAEIGFYHLMSTPLERSLPRLLERARTQGYRVVVRAASPERVEHLNAALWTYDEAAFLPHGSARDGNAAMHPIWLTHSDENPNGATMLVLVDGVEAENIGSYARCADLFDGNDAGAVIFNECVADDGAAPAQTDDPNANPFIGSENAPVRAGAHSRRSGGAGIKKTSAVHAGNAF